LWQEGKDTNWRASLENPHTGERRGFSNLESLFAFLQTTLSEGAQTEAVKDKRAGGKN
jgi:hypothetical protein